MGPDGLRWVIHDGVERQVSDFAALPPGRRPLCLCPQCGEKVIPHLGSILRHHAAHEPGSTCSATAPETELHLNAKFHLAAVLRNMQRLEIARTCSRCRSGSQAVWLESWDEVAVERQVGTRRPDVTLLRGGVPVGAVEVFASHRVDDEKALALANAKLPWIEVRADMIMPLAVEPWSGGPLLVANEGPSGPWECDACREGNKIDAFFKVHDYYYRSGKKFRRVYFAFKSYSAGYLDLLELNVLEGDKYSYLDEIQYPEPPSDLSLLTSAYKRHHSSAAARACLTDSPMKWSKREDLPYWREDLPYCDSTTAVQSGSTFTCETCLMKFLSDAYFPRRFCWDEGTSAWRIREGYESLRWEAPFRKWSNKIQHGSEVHHAHLGQGTVLSVGWTGPSDTADVMFLSSRRREETMPLNDLVPLGEMHKFSSRETAYSKSRYVTSNLGAVMTPIDERRPDYLAKLGLVVR